MYYANEVVSKLLNSNQIIIYGARIVGTQVANCLMSKPYNLQISGFMVTNQADNPKMINGIPVIDVENGKELYHDALILVAVLEKYLDDIMNTLYREGFSDIIPLTFESDLWSELRGNYYKNLCMEQGKRYLTLEEELAKVPDIMRNMSATIYMAKCHVDRPLHADMSVYSWEMPIQVGAALTDKQISRIRDNIGENISEKNRKYCELTALYWIWKNDKVSKYAGLCHYRRHFNLDKEQLTRLTYSDIDVVLTIPILNFPDVRTAYIHDHYEEDWEIMLQAVRKLAPEYYKTADRLQKGGYYYAYNMFIARKEIFDDYCAWLFPILEYCEKNCKEKKDTYQNRFIGFLGERLLSVYFLHHEDEYRIVHARKHFLAE